MTNDLKELIELLKALGDWRDEIVFAGGWNSPKNLDKIYRAIE